jgi:hypothetical protein
MSAESRKFINSETGEYVEIYQDQMPINPREEFDGFGLIISTDFINEAKDFRFENEYNDRFDFIENGVKEIKQKYPDVVIVKPIHVYKHGSRSYSLDYTFPFDCRWDSGTVGFFIVTKKMIRENYLIKRVSKKYIEMAENIMYSEISQFNNYCNGEVYCFGIYDKNGDYIDGCGGFYGNDWSPMVENMPNEWVKYFEKHDINGM